MKKFLLFGALALGSYLTANAQTSCATAIAITSDGEVTSPDITGEYGNNCWFGTNNQADPAVPLKSNWYKYTPTANGLLFISSDVATNPNSTDTRLSVFSGACGALQCYNGNDDISGNNYRSELSIPVESGVTYYIAWDNNWSAAGFIFNVQFTQSDCLSPNDLFINEATNVTRTSAVVSWDAAIGNPSSYDVEWGSAGFQPGTGAGTIVNTTTTSATLSGLPESASLDYYVRANCGATQGEWALTPGLKLAVTTPYDFNFDTAGDNADGFAFDSWSLSASQDNAFVAHSGTAFIFSNVSTTAPSDGYAFFRAMSLAANEEVTIVFRSLLIPAAAVGNIEATVGTLADGDSQTTLLGTFALTGSAVAGTQAMNAANYTERTVTYTAPAAGIYYFALHNNSAISPAAGSILVDTVETTSTLGTNDILASKLSVFPNPATNVINIANNSNILVNGVQITDLNGRTIKSVKFNDVTEAQVNVSDLANGIYMMTVSSDKGTMTQKIVKN